MNNYDILLMNLKHALRQAVHENPLMRKRYRQDQIIKLYEKFKNNTRTNRKWY